MIFRFETRSVWDFLVDTLCRWAGSNAQGAHNQPYVNPFVRGRRPPWWLRFSSTVGGQWPVTRIVEKPAPVASEFDWIPSPCSDGFRFIARHGWCASGWTGVRGPFGTYFLAGGLSSVRRWCRRWLH